MKSKITGTGCMLTAVIGSFIGANDNYLDATATAICAMGLSGELAYKRMCETDGGTNSLRMLIIDFMSKMNTEILEVGAKIESK